MENTPNQTPTPDEQGKQPDNTELSVSETGIDIDAFHAFDELAAVNEKLQELQSLMSEIRRKFQAGEISVEQYNEEYQPLAHNDLEYLTAKKTRLEAEMNPSEPKKLGRALMNLFSHTKNR